MVVVFIIRFLPYSIWTLINLTLKGLRKKVSIQLQPLKQYMKDASVAKKAYLYRKADIRPDIVPEDQYQSQVMLLPSKIMTHNMTNDFHFIIINDNG